MSSSVRASWLKIERDERRKLNIIVKKNVNKYPEQWDEIWPDDVEEIWDAERELNEDEIPFSCGEVVRNVRRYRVVLLKPLWHKIELKLLQNMKISHKFIRTMELSSKYVYSQISHRDFNKPEFMEVCAPWLKIDRVEMIVSIEQRCEEILDNEREMNVDEITFPIITLNKVEIFHKQI